MELRVVIECLLKLAVSYSLGSIVGSLVVGRLRGGVDIRKLGSGNAGGTNALRTQGKSFALYVMLIDIGKGWIATGLVAPLVIPGLTYGPVSLTSVDILAPRSWLAVACGLAVVLGHVYPVWYGFRGGKGVATVIGAVLGLYAWMLLPMLLTWLAAVMVFGFVGLASILGALALAAAADLGAVAPRLPLIVFGLVMAALIAYTHRSNIARMRAGTEPRARRLWLLGRLRRSA